MKTPPILVMGVDPGLFTTAYGLLRVGEVVEKLKYQNFEESIGKETLAAWRGKRNALEFLLPRVGNWFLASLKLHQPDYVVMESSNYIPKNGSNMLQQVAEVRGVLHYVTLIMRYANGSKPQWQTLSYLEVQRHLLGKVQRGSQQKGNMQEAVAKRLDSEILKQGKNNHICDALAAGITFAETKLNQVISSTSATTENPSNPNVAGSKTTSVIL